VFSPDQAVLDDAQIGAVKRILARPRMDSDALEEAFGQIEKVMDTPHKLYARYARKGIRSGEIFPSYFFETKEDMDLAVINAHKRRTELLDRAPHHLERGTVEEIYREIPGIVDRINPYA